MVIVSIVYLSESGGGMREAGISALTGFFFCNHMFELLAEVFLKGVS